MNITDTYIVNGISEHKNKLKHLPLSSAAQNMGLNIWYSLRNFANTDSGRKGDIARALKFGNEIGLDTDCQSWLKTTEGKNYIYTCEEVIKHNKNGNASLVVNALSELFYGYNEKIEKYTHRLISKGNKNLNNESTNVGELLEHMRQTSKGYKNNLKDWIGQQLLSAYKIESDGNFLIGDKPIKQLQDFIDTMNQFEENAHIDIYKTKN